MSCEPQANWAGDDSFTYYPTDGVNDSVAVFVWIDVTNETPCAEGDYYETLHDESLLVDDYYDGVLANDHDVDWAVLVDGPWYATDFSFNSNGTFYYDPQPNWAGGDSFTYRGISGLEDTGEIVAWIGVMNEGPTVNPLEDIFHWAQDTSVEEISLWDHFHDPDEDDDELAYTVQTNSNPAVVTTSIDTATGVLTLTFPGPTGVSDLIVRATDGPGEFDEQVFQVYVVDVTAYTVEERVLGSTVWSTPDDDPLLWKMDDHRWKADIIPATAEQHVTKVKWWCKSWEHRADPNHQATDFATVEATDGSLPDAITTPPPGDWAIRPMVHFPDGTTVTTTTYDRCVVCEVTGIEWEGYATYTDGEDNLEPPDDTHDDFHFFAEQNHPDQYKDADGATQTVADHELHNLVNVRVHINPAIPDDLGVSGTLDLRVYDPDNALIDGLPGTANDGDRDEYTPGEEVPEDNYGSGVGMSPLNFEMSFAPGQDENFTTFTIPSGCSPAGQ